MRSSTITLTVITLAAFVSQSCRKGSSWGIRGEGEKITETRAVSEFNAIDLSMNATVIYTQDSVYKLEVTAQRNILSVMDIKIEGNELSLDFKRNIFKHDGITLVIHSPNLKKVDVSGSGTFNATNTLSGNSLDVNISGSGNMALATLSLQSMNVEISGSGEFSADGGTCRNESFNISGSGNARTEFVNAMFADVDISGGGLVTLNASDKLKVNISGSGTIKYRGQPVVSKDISGSGKLIHID